MPRWSIKINPNPQGPASFSPQTQQAFKGDLISWANNDNANAHWPAPIQNGVMNKTGWLSEAIPPNASSKQSLTPSTTGTFNYCCAIAGHQNETGVIQVVGLVAINTNPTPTQNAPAVFAPSPAPANVGDTVLWSNNDSNQHQPMPAGGSPTAWFSTPIAAGQTATTSKPTSATGTVNYGCAVAGHQNETGVIQVAVSINANAPPLNPQAPASFSPGTVQANVGGTVFWANNDGNQHQPMPVGGPANAWVSTPIATGQTASSAKPTSAKGTVNYVCALHPGEKGVINVS